MLQYLCLQELIEVEHFLKFMTLTIGNVNICDHLSSRAQHLGTSPRTDAVSVISIKAMDEPIRS